MTPDSLLVDPCEPVSAGDTVRSLARAYVANVGCISQYRILLESQRLHKKKMEELYQK